MFSIKVLGLGCVPRIIDNFPNTLIRKVCCCFFSFMKRKQVSVLTRMLFIDNLYFLLLYYFASGYILISYKTLSGWVALEKNIKTVEVVHSTRF